MILSRVSTRLILYCTDIIIRLDKNPIDHPLARFPFYFPWKEEWMRKPKGIPEVSHTVHRNPQIKNAMLPSGDKRLQVSATTVWVALQSSLEINSSFINVRLRIETLILLCRFQEARLSHIFSLRKGGAYAILVLYWHLQRKRWWRTYKIQEVFNLKLTVVMVVFELILCFLCFCAYLVSID